MLSRQAHGGEFTNFIVSPRTTLHKVGTGLSSNCLKNRQFFDKAFALLGCYATNITLRNISEERTSQLRRGGSLKSRKILCLH